MLETFKKNRNVWLAISAVLIVMVFLLRLQGRIWWCKQGDYAPWSSDIFGSHNSQHLFDPYSFTHVLHGVFYFWILDLIFRKMAWSWKLFIAIFLAASWEVFENSSFIIERYRAATISLDYFGDSILNSLCDVLCCSFGFWLAYKLKFWRSLALFLLTEIVLIFWIHDSLLINVLMLIYPIDAIKAWQNGN